MGVIGLNKDLVQPIYGQVVRRCPKHGCLMHLLIRVPSPWYFTCKFITSYVIFIVFISLLFFIVISWL